jgi:ubiquinone/menaquinone biosynthesis C-methylase UbiE
MTQGSQGRRVAGRRGLGLGLAAALLFFAGQVYGRRSRARVVSHEGLDDVDVVHAFNRIATWPQMRALRGLVVRRALSLVRGGQAGDLGCGPGHLLIELARAAPDLQLTGIDLSEEMLARAEGRVRKAGLADRIALKKGDAARIPFPDGSLDLVISTLSLHHWSDPVGALDEIARVLRRPEPAQGRAGGSFLVFDLRRDMAQPFYLLVWFATRCVVPKALRRVHEPLASRDAAFTPTEAACLAAQSQLPGWRVTRGPLWLTIEGPGPDVAAASEP